MWSAERIIQRIIQGVPHRRSRFHTYAGDLVDLPGFVRDFPRALASTFALKLFHHRAERPWLGYRAVDRLSRLIQSDWRVLEFGSGRSTLWFARRCQEVVSIETDETWFRANREDLSTNKLANVRLFLRKPQESCRLDEFPPNYFDLVIVDGYDRDACMRASIDKVKAGGYLFFDNSDVPWSGHPEARRQLIEAAEPGSVEVFVDFYPFIIQVCESILGRKSADREGRAAAAHGSASG